MTPGLEITTRSVSFPRPHAFFPPLPCSAWFLICPFLLPPSHSSPLASHFSPHRFPFPFFFLSLSFHSLRLALRYCLKSSRFSSPAFFFLLFPASIPGGFPRISLPLFPVSVFVFTSHTHGLFSRALLFPCHPHPFHVMTLKFCDTQTKTRRVYLALANPAFWDFSRSLTCGEKSCDRGCQKGQGLFLPRPGQGMPTPP